MSEPFENTMTIEQLRREVRQLWDREHAFDDDLRNLPEVPSYETMRTLDCADFGTFWGIGKSLQRKHPFGTIPSKTEYEIGAGAWVVIRQALLAAKDHP